MNSENKIRIALCDDHLIMMQCTKSLLDAMGKYEVVVMAESGQVLIDWLETATSLPDVCVLDIRMPGMSGLQTMMILKKRWPELKVLILSMADDTKTITRMLHEGARGYLVKNCSHEVLGTALDAVNEHGAYFQLSTAINFRNAVDQGHLKLPDFSEQEINIMRMCYSGLGYKMIADKLGKTLRAVKGSMDNIFRKLNIHTRSELIIFALNNGIILVDP